MPITSQQLQERRRAVRRGEEGQGDLRDDAVRQLVLRHRGTSLTWLYKTRARSLKIADALRVDIGDARKEARRIAGDEEGALALVRRRRAAEASMKLGEVLDAFLAYRSEPRHKGGRLKMPKVTTLKDIRGAFGRDAITKRWDVPVATLCARDLEAMRDAISTRHSPRQATKAVAYLRSAFEHARTHHRDRSQLDEPFWREVGGVELVGEAALKAEANRRSLAVAELRVEEIGMLLARHDAFCASSRVSRSVRYGLPWLAFTGQRAAAATVLRWGDIIDDVPKLPEGWRAARWRGAQVKGNTDFVLPLPPVLVRMLDEMRGPREGWDDYGPFVFPNPRDGCLGESALRQHLRAMRGWRSEGRSKARSGPDLLADLPDFTLHAIRSTLVTHLDNDANLPEGTSSLIVGHMTKAQRQQIEAVPEVTSVHYSRAHRIERKARGMDVWVGALDATWLTAAKGMKDGSEGRSN